MQIPSFLPEDICGRESETMSMKEIRKIGITDLDTDAIVNAANDGLRADGGVCSAIFKAAGHDQLQVACNKIGHCCKKRPMRATCTEF